MYQEIHNISFLWRYEHVVCRYDKNDEEKLKQWKPILSTVLNYS